MRTGTFDEIGDALRSELSESGVSGETSPTSAPFRIPVDLIACVLAVSDVGSSMRERAAMCFGIRYESLATVIGDI